MRKSFLFFIIVLVLFETMIPYCGLKIESKKSTHVNESTFIHKSRISPSAYEESMPIVIDGNQNFTDQAALNSWPGTGSQEQPYIISNLNITSTNDEQILVKISNTDVYFRFEGNLLVGGSGGIWIDNVKNGVFVNNTIYDNILGGIYLQFANHVRITNNTIFGIQEGQGLYSYDSDNITVSNNTIYNNANRGILADYSSECNFSENKIFGNKLIGISLRDSSNNVIQNNTISDNINSGIVLGNSPYINITGNTISSNTFRGIEIGASHSTIIEGNIFYNNTMDGVSAGDSPPTLIANNLFYRNGRFAFTIGDNVNITYNNIIDNNRISGDMQALDEGSIADFIDNNYWDDWTAPDNDENGIVDLAYTIGGVPNNYDLHPRVYAYPDNRIHILTRPLIISPEIIYDNQFVCGEMNITWGPSSDTFGHSVIYSVYYSSNNSQDWSELVSGLTTTHYEWNTSMVPEGTNYTIIVQAECSEGLVANRFLDTVFSIKMHTLSVPTILYPNGGEIINETVHIMWTEVVDSWDYEFTYTVFYSIDGGENWENLTSGWGITDFIWNTQGVPRGINNLIKVVAISSKGIMTEDISDGTFTLQEHILTKPTILVPIGGESYNNIINIEWEHSIDSWNHEVLYSLYYSSDGGDSWTEIASNLTHNHYDWDISMMPEGSAYLIRVVASCSSGLNNEDQLQMSFTIGAPRESIDYMLVIITVVGVSGFIVIIVIFLRYKSKRQG